MDGEEVFEFNDYTTASSFEKLVASLETLLREWGLYGFSDLSDSVPSTSGEVTYMGGGGGTRLTLHAVFGGETGSVPVPEGGNNHFPRSMITYMDSTRDFPFQTPPLTRWFGVDEYLVLEPSGEEGGVMDYDSASLLLSALVVAMDYAAASLPAFVPVDKATWHPAYLGYLAHGAGIVHFETTGNPSVPQHAAHMDGLLAAFASLTSPAPAPTIPLPHSLTSSLPLPDRVPLISVRAAFERKGDWYRWRKGKDLNDPIPWGPGGDPIASLLLSTTWPQFPRDTFVDSPAYSDLEPKSAPFWTLCLVKAQKTEGGTTELAHDLLLLYRQALGKLKLDQLPGEKSATYTPSCSPLFPPPVPRIVQAVFRDAFKAAPADSLLASFAADTLQACLEAPDRMLPLEDVVGRWRGVAQLLRTAWESGTAVPLQPRLPPGPGLDAPFPAGTCIDTRASILAQKMEMIHLAILARAWRTHLVETDGAGYVAGPRVGVLARLEPPIEMVDPEDPSDPYIYVPLPPVPRFMTEDTMEEEEELLFQLGSTPAAAAKRAELQSAPLAADMATFKAANPGATLVDFVRWHSPRDYDPETNQLSGRFDGTAADNLWLRLWENAPRAPAWELAPLFDFEKEAEHALAFCEHLSPELLMELLLPVLFAAAAAIMVRDPVLSSLEYCNTALASFIAAVRPIRFADLDVSSFRPRNAYIPRKQRTATSTGETNGGGGEGSGSSSSSSALSTTATETPAGEEERRVQTEPDAKPVKVYKVESPLLAAMGSVEAAGGSGEEDAKVLISSLAQLEFDLALAASLRFKLCPPGEGDERPSSSLITLMQAILESPAKGGKVGPEDRDQILQAFRHPETGRNPLASTREFIFRIRKPFPYDNGIPLGHRMYVAITEDTFRVATAIAQQT